MIATGERALKKGVAVLHKNVVFTVALLAVILSSFFHMPSIASVNFKVLFTLCSMMLTVKALDKMGFLNTLATFLLRHSKTQRSFFIVLCLVSFGFSMFLTNDVAILTLLPIVFAVSEKSGIDRQKISIFVGIFAVLGSAVTPFGNTQNLSIYAHYKLTFVSFFSYMWPFLVLGPAAIFLCALLIPKGITHLVHQDAPPSPTAKVPLLALGLCALLVIASVFSLVPYLLVFPLVLAVVLLVQKQAIGEINYLLLLTLLFFYIVIDNLAAIPALEQALSALVKTPRSAYLLSILASQIISDVPATLLIAPFTTQAQALLYGANIGGLGTLVASFANLIAYNLYTAAYPQEKKVYFRLFSLYHLAFMLVLALVFWFLL